MSTVDTGTGTTTTATASAPRPSIGLVTVLRVGFSRAGSETRMYFRTTDSVFFTFLFPFIMLAIFTAAFGSSGKIGTAPDGTGGISVGAYYLPECSPRACCSRGCRTSRSTLPGRRATARSNVSGEPRSRR